MRPTIFNTHAFVKKLQRVGFTEVQAQALAEIVDEQIATKQDVIANRQTLELKIAELRSDLIKWVLGIAMGQAAIMMSFIALIRFLH